MAPRRRCRTGPSGSSVRSAAAAMSAGWWAELVQRFQIIDMLWRRMQCTRDMVSGGRASRGEAMVAARRIITLSIDPDQRRALVDISRSRTEATSRVERARMIIAYLDTPSAYVVARQIGVSHQTVTRCLERAAQLGVLAALDDRPRAGRDAVIHGKRGRGWYRWLALRDRKSTRL